MTDDAKKYDEERWGNQDNRYWIEEIKSDWIPFVDKSDVLDYAKILYVLHDNQALEDYPVAISPNANLLMGLCDRLNEYEEENEKLYEENERFREILEYGKINCKHLVSYEEGDYCMKVRKWFFDFEGYEDDCPTCKYCERR